MLIVLQIYHYNLMLLNKIFKSSNFLWIPKILQNISCIFYTFQLPSIQFLTVLEPVTARSPRIL